MSRARPNNLAARMGRWSASHWKTATFGWLTFVIAAFALGGMAGTNVIDPNQPGHGESGRMDRVLDAGFTRPAGESVLVQSDAVSVTDPAFAAAIEDVVTGISGLDAVQNVRSPIDPANAGQVADLDVALAFADRERLRVRVYEFTAFFVEILGPDIELEQVARIVGRVVIPVTLAVQRCGRALLLCRRIAEQRLGVLHGDEAARQELRCVELCARRGRVRATSHTCVS